MKIKLFKKIAKQLKETTTKKTIKTHI